MTGITPVAKKTVKDLVPSKRAAFTLAEVFSPHCAGRRKIAFTLAEVLITLGIIGIVAALTLPMVIEKHQKQVTVNKLKKVYSTLSQMIVKGYADNGPVTLSKNERTNANEFKQFLETYWFPYLSEPIVANRTFYGTSLPYTLLNGFGDGISITTDYSVGRVLFSTQDGTIYFVRVGKFKEVQNGILNFVYLDYMSVTVDINGINPPNMYGKDVFLFYVNFNNNIVKPYCATNSTDYINNNCKKNNIGDCCADKIIRDGWQIKDDYPW